MSETGRPNGSEQGGADVQQLRIQVVGQYVKDLSFENPGAPMTGAVRPQIDLGVDVQSRRLDTEHYEVELKLRVSAKSEEKNLFLLELVYAGLFHVQSAPEDILQHVLMIDGPHLLFPFARRIVADAIRDGGMPPLMLEPLDFAALFRAKSAEGQVGTSPLTA